MFNILQIIFAVVLTAAILLQARGSGLGNAFGGGGNIYRTKRGADCYFNTFFRNRICKLIGYYALSSTGQWRKIMLHTTF